MTDHHESPPIVAQLCESLPADQLSIEDVYALKHDVHSDITPFLGIRPDPKENIIVFFVTADSTFHVLGVEEDHGWEVLETVALDEVAAVQAAINDRLDNMMEWAETYYTSETFAFLYHGDREIHPGLRP